MIKAETKNMRCNVELNGTGGELLAEWASATESLFDNLIENSSVDIAKKVMKKLYKMARDNSIKSHSDESEEDESNDLFKMMGIGSVDSLLDKLPNLKRMYEAWESEQED